MYNNAFRPDPKYAFPSKEEYGKKRSFQNSWIRQFSWLCYSVSRNGGFCCTCVLFAKNFLSLGQLVTSPMVNFTRAKVTLSEHDKQSSHRMACQDALEFLSQMENGKPSVRQLLENELGTSIAKNRAILKSILKVIIFCGKQNISLRGHCEQIGSHSNHGNFLALVDFRLDAGDSILADHFKTCGRNAQYTSPQVQNDLISCVGEWIRKQIIQDVITAQFFSVSADEAVDCSNKEQLPLVLRYVDEANKIQERFVDFILCDTGVTGRALAEKILEALENYGLNVSSLRGQAYDGAGNMAGKCRGAAARIQSVCQKAVYVHCAAHTLNLCVVAACSLQLVKNMMGTMVEICLFFSNSPKRQLELERHAISRKLVDMCKTRWVARIDALEVFIDILPAVTQALEVISEGSSSGWNSDSCRSAGNLLTCISQFKFVITLIVVMKCLGYIKGLTTSLQMRAKDICHAYNEVSVVKTTLQEVRESVDIHHKQWFDIASELAEKINGCPPDLPRRCKHQTARDNTPADTPELYYKRTLSIPFLDELIGHITSRFSNIQQQAMRGLTLVPSVLVDDTLPKPTIEELVDYYGEDLPSPSSLSTELHIWKCKWSSATEALPNTPADALTFAKLAMFPNIHRILRLTCTLPVTSCECERSVSVLRRLKTYLRSTTSQERLCGLALMHMNYSMNIDLDGVINIFARKHPRRLALGSNIPSDI